MSPPSRNAASATEEAQTPNPHPTASAEGSATYEMSKSIPGLVAITTKIDYERYERGQTQ
jgi:hypothetical protein